MVEPLSLTRQIENIVLLFLLPRSPRVWSCGWTLIRTFHRSAPTLARSNRLVTNLVLNGARIDRVGGRGDGFSHPARNLPD